MLLNLLFELLLFSFINIRSLFDLFLCNHTIFLVIVLNQLSIDAIVSMYDFLRSWNVVGCFSLNIWVLVMDDILNNIENNIFLFVEFAVFPR